MMCIETTRLKYNGEYKKVTSISNIIEKEGIKVNIISNVQLSTSKPLIYVETNGNISTISKCEKVLNASNFEFNPIYLHVSIRNFYTIYQQGMIAQPNKIPTDEQQNDLARKLSSIAAITNKQKNKSANIFGVYNTPEELTNIIQHKKSIDQIAEAGGFKTFHTDDTEITNFDDDFNRYFVKILYKKD